MLPRIRPDPLSWWREPASALDQITHTATGFFLSRTGLGRAAPEAPWVLLLAANAPDLDVISLAGGPLSYINYHRQLTHSIAGAPLMALAAVAAMRLAVRRPVAWLRLWLVALAGVAAHLLLDLTNIYGMRLLLPFWGDWFHLDWSSVIDVWIWAAILVGLTGPVLVRLVNAEIGARPRKHAGRGFAVFALAFIALYNIGRGVLHERAVGVLDARLYDGAAPLRVAAFPNAANPFLWRGLVETADVYSLARVNLLSDFDPREARRLHKPAPSEAIEAARGAPAVRDFLRFSLYPHWQVNAGSEGEEIRVSVFDLRFGTPEAPAFIASAVLSPRLEPVRSWFAFGRAGPR
ncbi:MAG: metal-dependent hydrolase [Bryobacteraceae bacterium]